MLRFINHPWVIAIFCLIIAPILPYGYGLLSHDYVEAEVSQSKFVSLPKLMPHLFDEVLPFEENFEQCYTITELNRKCHESYKESRSIYEALRNSQYYYLIHIFNDGNELIEGLEIEAKDASLLFDSESKKIHVLDENSFSRTRKVSLASLKPEDSIKLVLFASFEEPLIRHNKGVVKYELIKHHSGVANYIGNLGFVGVFSYLYYAFVGILFISAFIAFLRHKFKL